MENNFSLRAIGSFSSIAFLWFFGLFCPLDGLQASDVSLLQKNPHLLAEVVKNNTIFSLEAPTNRNDLPDHFIAQSIGHLDGFEPIVIEGENQSAIVFALAESFSNEVSLLLNSKILKGEEKLFFYHIEGSSTEIFDSSTKKKLSGFKKGTLVLEWNGSKERIEKMLSESIIRNVYVSLNNVAVSTGFDASLDCHYNINCTEGQPFMEVKDGIVRIRIVVEEGIGYCSGSFINNTAEDFTPYILTAFHCMDGFTPIYDMWGFDLNYQGEICEDPTEEPGYQRLIGAEYIAGHQNSDFLLLKLTEEIPVDYVIPFLGWDRRTDYFPSNTALIHHPAGDIKKISLYNDPLRSHPNVINWNNGISTPSHSHYRQNLTTGTFEPGSSGSPLLSPEGRIMGQLHGGISSCTQFLAYSGILNYSWDWGSSPEERLSDWLDPLNTGQLTLDHSLKENPKLEAGISGIIESPLGDPVGKVSVTLDCGDDILEMETLSDGLFEFEVEFYEEKNCQLYLEKLINPRNGVNVIDIAMIRQHILKNNELVGDQLLAADVDDSASINVIDIAQIRQLILRNIDEFSQVPSWKITQDTIDIILVENEEFFFEIKALKMGDVDFSGAPSQ